MLHYPLPRPSHGAPVAAAEGVRWLRMPLPFALDHINLWWLDGGGESVLVDTGIATDVCREHWMRLLDEWMPGRIVLTHFHPDHMGLARWLQARTDAEVVTTRGEAAAAERIYGLADADAGDELAELFAAHGLEAGPAARIRERGNTYRPLVDGLPSLETTLRHDAIVPLAGAQWRVIVGRGHAPEHACLYRESDSVLIAGDQLLPRITSNVSVSPREPEADPLDAYLASLAALEALPADTLVLPSHGRPFYGIRHRIAEIRSHHERHLADLLAAAREKPLTAAAALPILFDRELDAHSLFFAMGEAIAHLNHLWHQGALERAEVNGTIVFATS